MHASYCCVKISEISSHDVFQLAKIKSKLPEIVRKDKSTCPSISEMRLERFLLCDPGILSVIEAVALAG